MSIAVGAYGSKKVDFDDPRGEGSCLQFGATLPYCLRSLDCPSEFMSGVVHGNHVPWRTDGLKGVTGRHDVPTSSAERLDLDTPHELDHCCHRWPAFGVFL